MPNEALIQKIDAALPQTQCEQCGFEGCLAYATALSEGESEINRCPPGGEAVLKALADIMERPLIPLDTTLGDYKPPQVVRIEEKYCIGCVKCILACPVDAIVGSRRLMHTVIQEECTGCELCIPPCPLNCIVIEPLEGVTIPKDQYGLTEWERTRAEKSRARFHAKKAREAERAVITETSPPQERELAEPTTRSNMLDLIALARKEFEKK